jgi:cold shock protein
VYYVDDSNDDLTANFVEGTVASFDSTKGWGFIALEGSEKDVFVHHEAIEGECTRILEVGDRVRFELIRGPKGPRAASVKKIDSDSHNSNPGK